MNLLDALAEPAPKIVACVSPDRKHIIYGGKDVPEGYTSWIIKFSEKHDPQTSGELEYRYSLAATAAGVTEADTRDIIEQINTALFQHNILY
jgi:serine/threonine-protein kinase HipA